jgi:hypothetical protein
MEIPGDFPVGEVQNWVQGNGLHGSMTKTQRQAREKDSRVSSTLRRSVGC